MIYGIQKLRSQRRQSWSRSSRRHPDVWNGATHSGFESATYTYLSYLGKRCNFRRRPCGARQSTRRRLDEGLYPRVTLSHVTRVILTIRGKEMNHLHKHQYKI